MKILGARPPLVLWVCRQVPWRSSKMMWCPHKSFLKFGLLSSYAFGCSDLASTWPYFCLSHLNLYGKAFCRLWFLSSGPCSLGQWLFAGCLLTGAGRCPLPCHEREAEQMGHLCLLVLLQVCLADLNRWWWLLPWEERRVPLGFTYLNSYSLLKKKLLGYGSKRIASSTILKIKQIQNHQTLLSAAFLIFFSWWFN